MVSYRIVYDYRGQRHEPLAVGGKGREERYHRLGHARVTIEVEDDELMICNASIQRGGGGERRLGTMSNGQWANEGRVDDSDSDTDSSSDSSSDSCSDSSKIKTARKELDKGRKFAASHRW